MTDIRNAKNLFEDEKDKEHKEKKMSTTKDTDKEFFRLVEEMEVATKEFFEEHIG